MMNRYNTMSDSSSYCGYFAAAATSARVRMMMDTALLAVSILLASVLHILVLQ